MICCMFVFDLLRIWFIISRGGPFDNKRLFRQGLPVDQAASRYMLKCWSRSTPYCVKWPLSVKFIVYDLTCFRCHGKTGWSYDINSTTMSDQHHDFSDVVMSVTWVQYNYSFQWKLRSHWLKFMRQCHVAVVIPGPGSRFGILRIKHVILSQQRNCSIVTNRKQCYETAYRSLRYGNTLG